MASSMTSTVPASCNSLSLDGISPTGKEIGRGAYGRVFEVSYEGKICAAKEVHQLLLQCAQDGDDFKKIKDDFLNECRIWSTLCHPCVVQFLGVYYPSIDQYGLPVIVMEKMQCSLRGLVEKYNNIPLNVKLCILDDVCLGIRYLHSRNPSIIHRDLTPNNILLGGHLEAKITDLGVAKVVKSDNQKTMTKQPGTPDFMSPEALSTRSVYGASLDVFSYGGIILTVTTQQWPRPSDRTLLNPDTNVWEIVSEVKRRQQYLDKMTADAEDLKRLAMSCLDDCPQNRPSVAQVCETIQQTKTVCGEKKNYDGMSPIVWWAGVSNEQQLEVTSSQTTVTEGSSLNNKRLLREEIDVLKTKKDELKNANEQLTTLLDKMAINNQKQIQQINSQSSEIAHLTAELQQLKWQHVIKKSTESCDLLDGPVKFQWKEGAPAPVGRYGHTAVWLNGLVYVGGGTEIGWKTSFTIDCYDPVNNLWSPSIKAPYSFFAMTTLCDNLLIIGGIDKSYQYTNCVLRMEADQFGNYTKMTRARSSPAAIGYQGMLIITGGKDNNGKLSSTELFDSVTGQWYACNDLPQPHSWLQPVIIDDKLYLLGGIYYNGASTAVFTASLDTLNRHKLKWNTHKDTPWPNSTPVCVCTKHLLIVGGCKNSILTSNVYKLNKDDRTWEAIGCIPSERESTSAVSTSDITIIVIGGLNKNEEIIKTVWIGSCDPQ